MANKDQEFLSNLLDLNQSGIGDIGIDGFTVIMTLSLLSSWLIAMLYLKFYGSRATGSQIHRAFPILGLSVSAIFICIQFSLPLSLGLLGALSIVRFRTPIKEPEEIGFIMLVIGSSIAIATFSLYFLLILLGFAIIALVVQNLGSKMMNKSIDNGLILLTVSSENYQSNLEQLKQMMNDKFDKPKIDSVSKSGDSVVVTYSFRNIKSGDPVEAQSAIVNLVNPSDINIYLNKQATL